jgi:hypothetical protein
MLRKLRIIASFSDAKSTAFDAKERLTHAKSIPAANAESSFTPPP